MAQRERTEISGSVYDISVSYEPREAWDAGHTERIGQRRPASLIFYEFISKLNVMALVQGSCPDFLPLRPFFINDNRRHY
jgi:hypothetical protein